MLNFLEELQTLSSLRHVKIAKLSNGLDYYPTMEGFRSLNLYGQSKCSERLIAVDGLILFYIAKQSIVELRILSMLKLQYRFRPKNNAVVMSTFIDIPSFPLILGFGRYVFRHLTGCIVWFKSLEIHRYKFVILPKNMRHNYPVWLFPPQWRIRICKQHSRCNPHNVIASLSGWK